VLPAKEDSAKDLGVFNMASAVPFALAPAIAPVVLAIASGGYGVLYALAGGLHRHRRHRHPAVTPVE